MKCLGLIGLGMIGGSIAAGLKRALPETRIVALDVSDDALRYGLSEGLIDDIAPTINAQKVFGANDRKKIRFWVAING